MKNRTYFLLMIMALLSLVLFALPACGSNAQTNDPEVPYVIADPTGDWGYPSPYLRYSRGPGYIRSSFIFDTLIWKDEKGFIPALAKKWTYNEADNTYTFSLQEDAKWHDGTPVTAEDVAFTIDYIKKHPDPFVTLVGPSGITKAVVHDEHSVTLYLETSYAPFLYDIAGTMSILPKHIWENVEDPMTFDSPEAVIGSGPYKLLDYNKAQGSYLYEAFDEYYRGKPEVDRIIFVKTSTEMVNAALTQGEVNAADIEPELAESLKADGFTIIRCNYTVGHPK
jgi:peptide/nickel transport system substrate-binding protein